MKLKFNNSATVSLPIRSLLRPTKFEQEIVKLCLEYRARSENKYIYVLWTETLDLIIGAPKYWQDFVLLLNDGKFRNAVKVSVQMK
jgi:hypothetical protein